ncbi:hypothetical protein HN588_11650 [Candidatus Bathyarchaeota archaeon]|jgi:hypothetical protein|nr:hypothetical protein [Candidatus Bathyarchaeota archaeon]
MRTTLQKLRRLIKEEIGRNWHTDQNYDQYPWNANDIKVEIYPDVGSEEWWVSVEVEPGKFAKATHANQEEAKHWAREQVEKARRKKFSNPVNPVKESSVGLDLAKSLNYTAVVLDHASSAQILDSVDIPEGWEIDTDHVTLFGPADQKVRVPPRWLGHHLCGQVVGIARNDQIVTGYVEFKLPVPLKGPTFHHVTIALNREAGGRPAMSNDFSQEDFERINPIPICGQVTEVPR